MIGCGRGAEIPVKLFKGLMLCVCLAACSAPVKLILPGKVDLTLASGDTMRLCTDDGVEDTTPNSDCVIMDNRPKPIAPYAEELKVKGWTREVLDPDGLRDVWTLMGPTSCKRLVVDAGFEKMTRKRATIVRFDFSEGPCTA